MGPTVRYQPLHHKVRTGLGPLTRIAVVVAMVATSSAAGGAAVALAADIPVGKVEICHKTFSNTKPYVPETPNKSGDVSGHADHVGPVWNPTLKALDVKWGDIIPPFDYPGGSFPGLNWDAAGMAIFNAGCTIPPPALSLTVVKTNNANGDATFTDDETAIVVGAPVTFKVAVTNTSAVEVTVDSVKDAVGGINIPVTCSLVGTTLAPGATATCTFTVLAYTPADGASKTNTVTVTVHEGSVGDEDKTNTKSASDTSVVRTDLPDVPPPPALSLSVVKSNDANRDGTFNDTETALAAGLDVTYRVVLTNNSPVAVTIDSLNDVVGAAAAVPVTCLPAITTTMPARESVTCTFVLAASSPAPGLSLVDTVTAVVHQTSNPANTTSGSDTSTVVTRNGPPPPPGEPTLSLTVVKTNDANGDGTFSDTENAPSAGRDVTYQVVLMNKSSVSVTIDSLTDVVGAAAAVPVTCLPAIATTLAAGAFATCTFVLAASSPAAGSSLVDTVTARVHQTSNPDNTTSGSDTATVRTPAAPPVGTPDLAIVKVGPVSSLRPGDTAGYTLTVRNNGTAPATSVVVDDVVPNGTTLTSLTAPGFTCSVIGIHCVLDAPLAANATAVVNVVVTLEATYSLTTVTNTATVGPTDATPGDNTSTVTTPVVLPVADLSIVKTGPAEAVRGETITWNLVVTNDGDAAALMVELSDTLASGLTLSAAGGNGWTCSGTTTVLCSLTSSLAPGATATVVIVATLDVGFVPNDVVNTAVVGPTDATPDNNTSTVTTPVVTPFTGGGGVVPVIDGVVPVIDGVTPVTDGGGRVTRGGQALPRTGAPIDVLGQLAPMAMLVGLLLVMAGRKRRTEV